MGSRAWLVLDYIPLSGGGQAMSKRIGAKGRRQSEIEEDEWYANYMNELRAEEFGLPSHMAIPDSGEGDL